MNGTIYAYSMTMTNTMNKSTSSRTLFSLIQRRLRSVRKDSVNTDATINKNQNCSSSPAEYPVQVPQIPRQHIVDQLRQLLNQNQEVLLYGPAHWGKSYLVQHNIQEDQGFKNDYDSILYLNLFTLRMIDPQTLDRETVRWLIRDSDKFEDYLEDKHHLKDNLLQHYLQDYFCDSDKKLPNRKHLLIIDHLELLADVDSIHAWLKKLRRFLHNNNIDTIWVDLCLNPQKSRLALWANEKNEIKSTLELPWVSETEIKNWLNPYGMSHLAPSVYDATGGNVMQLRDFFVYTMNKNTNDDNLVDVFIAHHADLYSRSCHSILLAIKKNPGNHFKTWHLPTDTSLQEAYLLSGVYRKDNTGLSIVSKVHAQRLKRLLTVNNLLLAAAVLELNDILRLIKNENLPFELATELMTGYLLSRVKNKQVFFGLRKFMAKLHHFHCEFYFQEEHRLIWFSIQDKAQKLQMLHNFPDQFQQAVWSGAPTVMQEQNTSLRLFVPVVGTSGHVELVVSGLVPSRILKKELWRRDLYIRKIWHVFQSQHRVLMRAVESFRLRLSQRQIRQQTRKLNKMVLRDGKQDELAFLSESESTAVILLKRVDLSNNQNSSQIRWVPRRILINLDTHRIPKEIFTEGQDIAQLDRLANREEAQGLVMDTDKSFRLFTKLESVFSGIQLFIKPVRVEQNDSSNEERELALFLFAMDENKSPDVISSARQQYLSILAHQLARKEYLKQLWRGRHQEEMALLNNIGFAMAKALRDPVDAQDSILHALKDYFNVEAISINDIVETENRHKEIHFRRGLGYSPGYQDIDYTADDSKTWLIDNQHLVIVSWKNAKFGMTNFCLDKEGTLLPYPEEISGRDQCAKFLTSGEVKVFLGAPILFQDLQSGEEKTIGILKLVNRIGEYPQIFSDREADSAGRIARLLAPFLYMLQNPDRYGLERRIKLMRSMFHAIGHEFRNPLNLIGGSAETALYDMDADAKLYPELSTIYLQKQRLTQTIEAIGQLANQESGTPVAVDLTQAVAQAWLNTGPDENKITFKFERPTKPAFVKIDKEHFIRALENIFKNAVEILQQVNSPTIVVSYVVDKGGLTRIIIIDNGSGLQDDKISWIFEPFHTSHEQKFINGVKPRGIGLALARIAIENAGGKIYCKNNNKAGASFFLEIPSC